MTTDQKLVRASHSTQAWLRKLREQVSELTYTEAKYWATFRDGTAGAVAQLNPSQASIRVFLTLDSSTEPELKPSPSTQAWAARFPSVFQITAEGDLKRAGQLILMSADAARERTRRRFSRPDDRLSAEEVDPSIEYVEGAVRRVTVNAYERDQGARDLCLRHYGRNCVVCGFNFREAYGADAGEYIQVHHIKPIARAGGEYVLNPLRDLRPVCPNCHAVIHRRDPPFEIAEVRRMLRTSTRNHSDGR